jgi:glutamate dehydrogenase (NADP+)
MDAKKVLDDIKRRFPNEPEYHQAVSQVLPTIEEEYNKHPEFDKLNLIERLCIPDRVYQFRVTWTDDKGNVQTNMGYRVQHNNAIGPYKAVSLPLLCHAQHPEVLAFERLSRTHHHTALGGGNESSDFSPRGKSIAEVMALPGFMLELTRHIGPNVDVPEVISVSAGREWAHVGMYKKLTHGVQRYFHGKGIEFGVRHPTEATGYGNILPAGNAQDPQQRHQGQDGPVSGSGNVAQYTSRSSSSWVRSPLPSPTPTATSTIRTALMQRSSNM